MVQDLTVSKRLYYKSSPAFVVLSVVVVVFVAVVMVVGISVVLVFYHIVDMVVVFVVVLVDKYQNLVLQPRLLRFVFHVRSLV